MRRIPLDSRCWVFLGAVIAAAPLPSLAENTKYQMGFDDRDGVVDVFYFGKDDTYAAIAYSPKTGKYGYSQGCYSREIAEREARRHCPADDTQIVAWVCNGFCALAVGDDDTWGSGFSNDSRASNSSAKDRALAECRKRGPKARVLICICSVKRKPEVFE